MEQLFTWKWEKDEWKNKYISIYSDNLPFGRIPNLEFTGVSVINRKQFYVIRKWGFAGAKQYIADPKTNERICEVVLYGDESIHIEIEGKSKYQITQSSWGNSKSCVTFFKEKNLYPKSGFIKINSKEDIELLIYASFFADELNNTI